MAGVKRLEDLIAWQRAMSLCKAVDAVSPRLPDSEKFGSRLQLRRAVVSVPSNIAEGFGRGTRQEMLRFLGVARGSLFEVRTQLLIAIDLEFLAEADSTLEAVDEADRVLQGLIRSMEELVDA